MPEELVRIYWDADVLLSYVNGVPDRLPDIDGLLERSGRDFQIVTSSISIVEVSFGKAEQDGKALDPEIESRLDSLWTQDSPIRLVEFYPLIADGARDLLRRAMILGWGLKPMDAIHLSTARQQGVSDFHTYDQRLEKYAKPGSKGEGPLLNFTIGPPKASQLKILGT